MVGEHGPRKDCHIISSTPPLLFPLLNLTFSLAGDLFYLDVRTLEGNVYYVTAWTHGFFVNNTKQGGLFDPSPAPASYASHNLVDLLNKISPKFQENFKYILTVIFDPHSLDYQPAPLNVVPWLAVKEEHKHDVHRAEMDTVFYSTREIMCVFAALLVPPSPFECMEAFITVSPQPMSAPPYTLGCRAP